MMHAALEINLPSYASAIVTTNEIIEALSSKYAAVFDPAGDMEAYAASFAVKTLKG